MGVHFRGIPEVPHDVVMSCWDCKTRVLHRVVESKTESSATCTKCGAVQRETYTIQPGKPPRLVRVEKISRKKNTREVITFDRGDEP